MASRKSIRADYGPLRVKRATATHAGKLQHLLRVTDLRECMIHGATPWRALHYPLTVDGASTYSIMLGKTPICMGGVVPIDPMRVSPSISMGTTPPIAAGTYRGGL
jgi:hypothetical protein